MAGGRCHRRLVDASPELERLLVHGSIPPARFSVPEIRCETVWVAMRDGVRLATDLYHPPVRQSPVVVVRTPYGRSSEDRSFAATLSFFARRGYAVVSQDCRGTGDSEPDSWDYYVFESEDSIDLVEWISKQPWFGGFIGSFGSSYAGQTQWCMAAHPAMSAIIPTMSGLGIAGNTARLYMFINAYARTVGKGENKVSVNSTEMERLFEKETMAGGYFNEPLNTPLSPVLLAYPKLRGLDHSAAKRWLWQEYCDLTCAERAAFIRQALGIGHITSAAIEALPAVFGHHIAHDAHAMPQRNPRNLCRSIKAAPLLITGWYDWCLNDALATWNVLRTEALEDIASRVRMVITPHAHNMPGYHEGVDAHPELLRVPNGLHYAGLELLWYEAVRERATASWPAVIYYLMGANEWRIASDWPVPEATQRAFYLGGEGALTRSPPQEPCGPYCYSYDPDDPTPTIGGSILSYLYPQGSVDVSAAQRRSDVAVFTSSPLEEHLDVVGPLRMILYASSSAVDTDFAVRLSDVFPDGRAIQLQSGMLRARYRNPDSEPELLAPGRIYRLEVDMWATANRFKAGHRLRVDIASADFPHFDRNSNRGGQPGDPIVAHQAIYHGPEHPSHLLVWIA